MRGLLAILYFMALGYMVARYELDKKALEAAHGALTGLMRESAHISLEVYRSEHPYPLPAAWGQGWVYQSARPLGPEIVCAPVVVPPHG